MQMQELQRRQDPDKVLALERHKSEPAPAVRMPAAKPPESPKPKSPPVEKPKAKIKKKNVDGGDFDLLAQMAKMSRKNEQNQKPGYVPSPAKAQDRTIEEIQRRDQERDRMTKQKEGEWKHFSSNPSKGTIANSLVPVPSARGGDRSGRGV